MWWNDKNLGDTESVPPLRGEHDGYGFEGEGNGVEGERGMNHNSSGMSGKEGGDDEITTTATANHKNNNNASGKSDQWEDVGGGESSNEPLQDQDVISPTMPMSR